MDAITNRHQDLLYLLLSARTPVSATELAIQLKLTPRQVHYDLKALSPWLIQRGCELSVTRGVGVRLICTPQQRQQLARELAGQASQRFALSPNQRQQLLALLLLTSDEPHILFQLQHMAEVSRSTVLNDLVNVELWLAQHRLVLERRRNYGFLVLGQEADRRQALAAWAWGSTPWEPPAVQLAHGHGLLFSLPGEADALPLVAQARERLRSWDLGQTVRTVAQVETSLGGRFTDDGALFLALVLAIQSARVAEQHTVSLPVEQVQRLQALPVWNLAHKIGRRLAWQFAGQWSDAESAMLTMYLLATPRNERWPGDLETDPTFGVLVPKLMQRIANAYGIASLASDSTLSDGLITHVVPACFRQRFGLWFPLESSMHLADRGTWEQRMASDLVVDIRERAGVTLPTDEINNIAMLLEAAYIRERPGAFHQVLVVCPSGMATAQLLVARLKARFPYLGTFKVVSLRALSPQDLASADLVLTTVPLADPMSAGPEVLQVHPLLPPEDVTRITRWLHDQGHK